MDLVLIALGLAALMLKGKQETAESLEFYPQSLALSNDKKTLWLVTEILNPTSRPLVIDSLFVTIYAGSTKIGSIEKTVPFTIRKTGRSQVKFPIRVSASGLGKVIAMFIQGKSLIFRIVGRGESEGIMFPVSEEIPLDL